MSLTVYTALLLLLADISTGDIFDCKLPFNDATQFYGYTLEVSPETVINGSTYTVTITGRGNATVHPQYFLMQPDFGWFCMKAWPINHDFDVNNTLVVNSTMHITWKPNDYYLFRVVIVQDNLAIELSRTLTAGPYPGNTGLAVHPVSLWLEIISALGLLWITSKQI